jgi:hypothetical protein
MAGKSKADQMTEALRKLCEGGELWGYVVRNRRSIVLVGPGRRFADTPPSPYSVMDLAEAVKRGLLQRREWKLRSNSKVAAEEVYVLKSDATADTPVRS